MEIGTGIFGGALFLGGVALYIFTRDRWKWKRGVFRALLGLLVVGGAVALLLWGVNLYDNRITTHHEFLSIRLDDTPADIKFKKGQPFIIKKEGQPIEAKVDVWGFKNSSDELDTAVVIREGKVKMVLYLADCAYCERLHGLGIGSLYSEVTETLGPPSHTAVSNDELERLISFEDANLVFHLKKGKVAAFGIFNPALGPPKFKNEPTG